MPLHHRNTKVSEACKLVRHHLIDFPFHNNDNLYAYNKFVSPYGKTQKSNINNWFIKPTTAKNTGLHSL